MTLTFVTALYDIGRPNFYQYFEWTQKLIDLDLPLLIFLGPGISLRLTSHTKVISIESLPLIDRLLATEESWKEFKTDNPEKDTPLFSILSLSKFRWLQMAIEMNVHQASHYAWIDAGIAKNSDLEIVSVHLRHLPLTTGIRAMVINKFDAYDSRFPLSPRHGMAGGFFYGPTRKIWDMATRILERSSMFLQENIAGLEQEFMTMDYIDYADLYDVYYGDYYDLLYNCFFERKTTHTVIKGGSWNGQEKEIT